jgi:hemerythrin superfamily protein
MSDGTIDSNGKAIEKPKSFRNKTWLEMDKDEHIEKLRQELVRTQRHLEIISRYMSKLIEHDHMDGRIVTRLERFNEESCGNFNFRVSERLDS